MAMINEPRIALRIIVDGTAAAAEAAWAQIQVVFEGIATVSDATIKPYWKFEGSHEIAGTLTPSGLPEDAFEAIVRGLGSGWAKPVADEFALWTVWNRGDGQFCAPFARWAHVELIRK